MRSASRAVFVAICSVFLTLSWPGGLRSAAAEQSGAARYQCPMHPSYMQDRPGECAVCGMKLVPVKAVANVPDLERRPMEGEPSSARSAGTMRIDREGQK